MHDGLFVSITDRAGGGSPSAPQRESVHMAASTAEAIATSDMTDDYDLAFDFDLNIDAVEYSRIMRRIGIDGDETVTQISAFNSSI
ncbi:MAG: hypothetical protein ABSA02_21380 [Trebonia sp.]